MVSYDNGILVLKLVPDIIHHGRNVWKSTLEGIGGSFLFYGGEYWWIGSDYKNNTGYFSSLGKNLETFPTSNWTCSSSHYSTCIDAGLVIETYNPDMLMVSRDGDAAFIHAVKMGIYTKIKGMTINGNSVWAHASGKQFIYFMDNVWKIGADYYDSNGGIKTSDVGNPMINDQSWLYFGVDGIWHKDDSISVKTYYPEMISVGSSSNSRGGGSNDAFEWFGIYEQVPELMEWNRPVWKHVGEQFYLHYTGNSN